MKVTITGAGSIVFSMSIVNDLTRKDTLDDIQLALMDVDGERLGLVATLAERLGRIRGRSISVTATTSLEHALDGADVVVNAAAVGERSLWPGEREIARRHGYWPSKGFRVSGLRNVAVTLGIAQEMERRCPDAWLLQHSNQMAGNVGTVARHTRVKVAGFCHGVENTIKPLAEWMGIERSRVDAEAAGMNHYLFLTRWYVDGRDAMPELVNWVDKEFHQVWDTAEWQQRLDVPGPVTRDLALRLGLVPCNGDEHLSDYFRWYTTTPELRERFRAKTDYLDRYIARGEDRLSSWEHLAHGADDSAVLEAFSRSSGERAADVIEALVVPGTSVVLHVILPNGGALQGLPEGSGVEVPAVVTTDAIRPVGSNRLPPLVTTYVAMRMEQEELEAAASIEQSRELTLRSLELDPYTESLEQATAYVSDLAAFDREHLPWLS